MQVAIPSSIFQAEHPHPLRKVWQFCLGNISPYIVPPAPSLLLKELITSMDFSGQGEGQRWHYFSAALFQVISNKGQQPRPLTLCCQSDTPDQPLCSSEGRICSTCKVTCLPLCHKPTGKENWSYLGWMTQLNHILCKNIVCHIGKAPERRLWRLTCNYVK